MPLGFHVIQRLEDDRVLVRDVRERRIYADTVARAGRESGLFVFGLPDNHAHAGVECDREQAGRFAQRFGSSLKQRLGLAAPFAPAKIVPIRDQVHLKNAFAYMLGQAAHHGVDADPWLEATCVPDLLGLRLTASYLLRRTRAILPRLKRSDLLAKLGVPELGPGTSIDDLADAAAATVAEPDLLGRRASVVAARRAAVAYARNLEAPTVQIAQLLSLTTRAILRLAQQEVEPRHVRAVGLQLGLRSRVPAAPVSFDR
jgi:hypothetical protein